MMILCVSFECIFPPSPRTFDSSKGMMLRCCCDLTPLYIHSRGAIARQLPRDVGLQVDIADGRDALPSLDAEHALHADSVDSV